MKDIFSLKGKVALVTGGSRGIGAMIVQGFLEHGCSRVYITARKAAQCDAAAKELSLYGECISIPGDVSTQEGITALAKEIAQREPKLDILVNNAGAAWGADFDEFPESGWDKTVDLNMKTPFSLLKHLHRNFVLQLQRPALQKSSTLHLLMESQSTPWRHTHTPQVRQV